MPMMTLDLVSPSTTGKEASPAPSIAGGASQPGTDGTSASGGAFGQAMAQAIQKNAGTNPAAAADPLAPPTQAVTLGLEPVQLPTEISGKATAAQTEATPTDANPASGAGLSLLPPWLQAMAQPLSVQPMNPGSSLQVITTSGPAPDDASLIAFAQAQGMDAQSIAQLLGQPPPATPSAALTGNPGLPASGTLPPGALAGMAAPGLVPVAGSPMPGSSLTNPMPATPAGSAPAPGMTDAQLQLAAAAVTALRGEQAATAAGNARLSPEATTEVEITSPLTQSLVLPGMRRALTNAATTETLARTAANWTFTTPQAKSWNESELDLSDLLAADNPPESADATTAASPTLQSESPPTREANAQPLALTSANPAAGKAETSNMQATHKLASDQMQQLNEQMADAIGERMMREIERGHWNLRLMLKPAHLGHIEVEMRLHAGGLEATFTAPQANTRELLQDGLDRLRAHLSEAGMDIANLDVKTGQNRQNGGDPTPGQQASAGNASGNSTAEQPAPTLGSPARPARPDGWDVMV